MTNGKRIQAPVAAFNNFILEIGNELKQIFDEDLYTENNVMFDNTGIILFGVYRLWCDKNSIQLKINTSINKSNLKQLNKIISNLDELEGIIYKYLFTLNQVSKNMDDSVSYKYCETIVSECLSLHKNEDKTYLIPYQHKIYNLFDKDETIQNIFDRYTYVLNVRSNGPKQVEVKMIRLLSSELSQNSIDNIKILEKEIIRKCLLTKEYFPKFIKKLMFYGEFDDGRSL